MCIWGLDGGTEAVLEGRSRVVGWLWAADLQWILASLRIESCSTHLFVSFFKIQYLCNEESRFHAGREQPDLIINYQEQTPIFSRDAWNICQPLNNLNF